MIDAVDTNSQAEGLRRQISGPRVKAMRKRRGTLAAGARCAGRQLRQPDLHGRARPVANIAAGDDRAGRRTRHVGRLPRQPGRRLATGPDDRDRAEDQSGPGPRSRGGPHRPSRPPVRRLRRNRRDRRDGGCGLHHSRRPSQETAQVPARVGTRARAQSRPLSDRPRSRRGDGAHGVGRSADPHRHREHGNIATARSTCCASRTR